MGESSGAAGDRRASGPSTALHKATTTLIASAFEWLDSHHSPPKGRISPEIISSGSELDSDEPSSARPSVSAGCDFGHSNRAPGSCAEHSATSSNACKLQRSADCVDDIASGGSSNQTGALASHGDDNMHVDQDMSAVNQQCVSSGHSDECGNDSARSLSHRVQSIAKRPRLQRNTASINRFEHSFTPRKPANKRGSFGNNSLVTKDLRSAKGANFDETLGAEDPKGESETAAKKMPSEEAAHWVECINSLQKGDHVLCFCEEKQPWLGQIVAIQNHARGIPKISTLRLQWYSYYHHTHLKERPRGKYDESQVFAGNDISYNPNSSVHCKAVVLDPDDYLQWRQALAAKDHTTARKFVDPTQVLPEHVFWCHYVYFAEKRMFAILQEPISSHKQQPMLHHKSKYTPQELLPRCQSIWDVTASKVEDVVRPFIRGLYKPVYATDVPSRRGPSGIFWGSVDAEGLQPIAERVNKVLQTRYPRVDLRLILDPDHPVYQGFSAFALQDIGPNEMIMSYTGVIYADRRKMQYEHRDDRARYIVRAKDYLVDATPGGNEGRFVNDFRGVADEANAEFLSDGRCRFSLNVWSNRPIKKGTEILVDYGATYWRMIDPTVLDLTMKPKPHRPELNCSVKWQDIVQRHHSLLYLPVHVHSYDWEEFSRRSELLSKNVDFQIVNGTVVLITRKRREVYPKGFLIMDYSGPVVEEKPDSEPHIPWHGMWIVPKNVAQYIQPAESPEDANVFLRPGLDLIANDSTPNVRPGELHINVILTRELGSEVPLKMLYDERCFHSGP
uniref:SET domain-containing protein n=1 Tax=Eutreptiella gymnastica TaxID=73025 RepID=A0A6T1X7G2_9EUGL